MLALLFNGFDDSMSIAHQLMPNFFQQKEKGFETVQQFLPITSLMLRNVHIINLVKQRS
jgi:hypothetical protein